MHSVVSIVTLDSQIVLVNKRKAMADLSYVTKAENTGGQGFSIEKGGVEKKGQGQVLLP